MLTGLMLLRIYEWLVGVSHAAFKHPLEFPIPDERIPVRFEAKLYTALLQVVKSVQIK